MCRYNIRMAAAHAICQSNNFAGALSFVFGSAYGTPSSSYGFGTPICTGYETFVTQCPTSYFHTSLSYCPSNYLSIVCSSKCQILI